MGTTHNPLTGQTILDGNASSYLGSLISGEEGAGSPQASAIRTNNRSFLTQLASSASAQNIGGGVGVPVYIKGITLVSTSANTITIAGIATPISSPSLSNNIVIPAITTTVPYHILPHGPCRAFTAGCQITCATAADGLLVLVDWDLIP